MQKIEPLRAAGFPLLRGATMYDEELRRAKVADDWKEALVHGQKPTHLVLLAWESLNEQVLKPRETCMRISPGVSEWLALRVLDPKCIRIREVRDDLDLFLGNLEQPFVRDRDVDSLLVPRDGGELTKIRFGSGLLCVDKQALNRNLAARKHRADVARCEHETHETDILARE
jgi:hypothetical protein